MNMDARVGADFEAGLARLRMLSEAEAQEEEEEAASDEAVRKYMATVDGPLAPKPPEQPAAPATPPAPRQ
jgi:hypothetical protein